MHRGPAKLHRSGTISLHGRGRAGVSTRAEIRTLPQLGCSADRHDRTTASPPWPVRESRDGLTPPFAMVHDYDCWHAEHALVTAGSLWWLD